MPTEVLTVRRVDPCKTANPYVFSFCIWGTTVDTERCVTYQTISRWQATLCQRAMETRKPIRVIWAESRYGDRLIDVELA